MYLHPLPLLLYVVCTIYSECKGGHRSANFWQTKSKKKNYFQFLKSPSYYAMACSAKINVQYMYNRDTYNVPSFYTSSRKVYFLLPCRRRLNIFGDFANVCLVLVITNPPFHLHCSFRSVGYGILHVHLLLLLYCAAAIVSVENGADNLVRALAVGLFSFLDSPCYKRSFWCKRSTAFFGL